MDTTKKVADRVHHKVFVTTEDGREPARNACNVLRGDFSLPATGEVFLTSDLANCPRCDKALHSLGLSLSALADALRPQEQVDAERRRYAAMSYTWSADSFRKHVTDMAADLRRKAEELERLAAAAPATVAEYHAAQAEPFGRENMATDAAAQATHVVMWMMANLNLDGLVGKGVEVDRKALLAKK